MIACPNNISMVLGEVLEVAKFYPANAVHVQATLYIDLVSDSL